MTERGAKAQAFMAPTRIGFQDWVQRFLVDLPSFKFPLKKHQRIISRFLAGTPYRGVLVYHGLGLGKSCAAIAAAEAINASNIFVMLPASLKSNFKNEFDKCGGSALITRITWVSMNGIPRKQITRKSIAGKPLEGGCIIIDEVHNFISQVVNGGSRGAAIYDALYNSRNIKIIALSGTPIINDPFEIGMLLNLINGPIRNIVLRFRENDSYDAIEKAVDILKSNKWVDMLDVRGKVIRLWLTPFPFHRDLASGNGTANLCISETPSETEQAVVMQLWQDTNASTIDSESTALFPMDEDSFNGQFLSKENLVMVNTELFMQRCLGKVSFFKISDQEMKSAGFPRVIDKPVVYLRMSNMQFDSYIAARSNEIRIEKKVQKQNKIGVFRAFSRAVCNFAFDSTSKHKRLFPSTYRAMLKEMDLSEDTDDPQNKAGSYNSMLDTLLSNLENAKEELRGQKLAEHSPKFVHLLKCLKEDKKALVYSQFRRVEGVGMLQLVLRANGFSRFQLSSKGEPIVDNWKKPQFVVFDSTSKQMANLLALFNGDTDTLPLQLKELVDSQKLDFRALLITQSAAEGANLRGVRAVYILEPFWNEVRVQQVIGRATRVGSHSHLPPSRRTVEVTRYVMQVPEGHTNFTVRNVDDNLSSDQVVMQVAKQKMRIIDSFLTALRASAIDCKKGCFQFPAGLDPGADVRSLVPASRKMQVIQLGDAKYLLDPETGQKFRYDVWIQEKKLVPL